MRRRQEAGVALAEIAADSMYTAEPEHIGPPKW